MCLALIAWQCCASTPLVVGFNRDEFFNRPTETAQDWEDYIGGQDLISQGTWLGIKNSKFGAVTNLRKTFEPGTKSRGQLVRQFIAGHDTAVDFVNKINYTEYNHFNLLLCDGNNLVVATNPKQQLHMLSPGTYMINNDEFDPSVPNPLQSHVVDNMDKMFALLEQHHVRKDSTYGTRSSTVIINDKFVERTYDANGFVLNQIEINK
jgi:uncharacterized protein with NRDE domain